MEFLIVGLVGVLVGAVAATGSVLVVLRRQSDRDLIERRLRACSRYRECLGDLARVLDSRGDDAEVVAQAWKNVADFCEEYRLSSWLFEADRRAGLDGLVEELEVAEALYRTNGTGDASGTTELLANRYREVDSLLGRELQRHSREYHDFRLFARPRSEAEGPRLSCWLVLSVGAFIGCLCGPACAVEAGDVDEEDAEPGESSSALSDEELARRTELLRDWVYEPVELRSPALTFSLDRADSSFFVEDGQTGTRWHSGWGRRGFASLLVRRTDESGEATEKWILLDRVDGLVATDKRIRFRALSYGEGDPHLDVTVELAEPDGALVLRYEVPQEFSTRVEGVRVLENALWIGDAEERGTDNLSGAMLPHGSGEWVRASLPARTSRLGSGTTGTSPSPLTLPFLALAKRGSVLQVSWGGERPPLIDVVRDAPGGDFFPGRVGLFLNLAFDGSGPAELRITALGGAELGFVEAARRHRALEAPGEPDTLRFKSGQRRELRTFPSAPLLVSPAQTPQQRRALVELTSRLRDALKLDSAVLALSDWQVNEPSPQVASDPSVEDLIGRIRASGYLAGLEVRLRQVLERGEESLPDSRVEALLHRYSPDLVLLRPPAESFVPAVLCQSLADEFGLVGLVGPAARRLGAAAPLRSLAYAGNLLEPADWTRPGQRTWPLLTATYGQTVRLGLPWGKPLRPGDMTGFLVHLLLGVTPAYDAEALLGSDPPLPAEVPFAPDDGWVGGKGLSAAERFLKNTCEVASHLSSWRYRLPLLFHRPITDDGRVRESYFGPDLRVLVNFGPGDYEEEDLVLPPNGFVVKYPFFLAFYAKRMHGFDYDRPAFFTVRSLEGKMYLRASKVRLYRGFGPSRVRLGGKMFEVERESQVKIW